MEVAMAKPLVFGRTGGPGPHPTQADVMAKPAIVLAGWVMHTVKTRPPFFLGV